MSSLDRGSFDFGLAAECVTKSLQRLKHGEAEPSDFWQALEDAYPPGFFETCVEVKAGNSQDFDPLIEFLEADPYFFRSGYVKGEVVHILKQRSADLSNQQRARLEVVVINAIQRPAKREFPGYARLGPKLNSPEFRAKIESLLTHDKEFVRKQASQIHRLLG